MNIFQHSKCCKISSYHYMDLSLKEIRYVPIYTYISPYYKPMTAQKEIKETKYENEIKGKLK